MSPTLLRVLREIQCDMRCNPNAFISRTAMEAMGRLPHYARML